MTYFYIVPQSFLKFSIVIQIIFASILFLVAYFSFKIYRISKQREIKLFGISFLFIAISYILWAIIHLAIVSPAIISLVKITTSNIARLGVIGILSYVVIFITGLTTLAYTTLKIKSGKMYYLLLTLILISLLTPLVIMLALYEPIAFRSLNTLLITSRVLSIFLLTFIIYNYFEEYSKNRNKKTLLVGIAFSLLLLSNIDLLFSITYYQAYIIGNILEFIAYLFILTSLILSLKK